MNNAQVRAFYGSKGGGGLRGTHVAICTIEKANALVNKMAEADVSDGDNIDTGDRVHVFAVLVSCLLYR